MGPGCCCGHKREVSPRAELSVEGGVEWSIYADQLSLAPVGLGVLPGHLDQCSSGNRIF